MQMAHTAVRGTQVLRGSARLLSRLTLYVALALIGIVMTVPTFWSLTGSIKTPGEILIIPPTLWPAEPQWDNYAKVWEMIPFGRFFLNTVFVTVVGGVGQIASTAVVGYGFARFRFPGRDLLFLVVLSTIMLPPELTMIPLFIVYKNLGWLDTYLPLTVPYFFGAGAFFIFLFRQFFMTIPLELDEAARIDGAGYLRIFASLIVPLSMPAFAAAAIVSFLSHWNDFVQPLIYLSSTEKFTLSLGITAFRSGGVGGFAYEPRDHLLMASVVMMTLPTVVVFFLAQRYFIQGIVMSGFKG